MKSNSTTFNGSHITDDTTGTVTYPFTGHVYDTINYCPYCGSKVQNDFKFCPQCSKEIPRTYTGSNYIIHWNYGDGTPSYPDDRISYGNKYKVTC